PGESRTLAPKPIVTEPAFDELAAAVGKTALHSAALNACEKKPTLKKAKHKLMCIALCRKLFIPHRRHQSTLGKHGATTTGRHRFYSINTRRITRISNRCTHKLGSAAV